MKAASGSSRAPAFVVALAVCLILQFAAVSKILGPNPKVLLLQPGQYGLTNGLLLDYAAGAAELVVVLFLMAWHRCRGVWPLVSMMFASFAGYSYYWTARGEKCGCFGSLWQPPIGVTLAIDIAVMLLALLVGAGLRLGKAAIVLTLILNVGLGYAGYRFAQHNAPPPRTQTPGQTAPDRLLGSELMSDVRGQPPGGPRWFVFVHDPQCHICEQMKPVVEMYQQQYDAGDPTLRIRVFAIPDLEAKLGIPFSEWFPTPTVFLVQDGKVVYEWHGESAPLPTDDFVMKVASGQLEGGTPR